MNKFITFTLVLFAMAAMGNCNGYNAGPAVERVALSSLPNIESYLNGAQTAYGPAASYGAQAGPAVSVSYGPAPGAYAAPALSQATSIVVPSSQSYSAAAHAPLGSAAYGAPSVADGYGAPARGAYGAAPKISIQPAFATQLYPGQHNYKAYVSPPQHSKVALPILPSDPVAKLFVPQQAAYGAAQAPQASYSAGGY